MEQVNPLPTNPRDIDELLKAGLGERLHETVVNITKAILIAALERKDIVLLVGGEEGLHAMYSMHNDPSRTLKLLNEGCLGIASMEREQAPGGGHVQ